MSADHAQRIRQKIELIDKRTPEEEHELDQICTILLWITAIFAAIPFIIYGMDVYAEHKYSGLIRDSQMFVDAMNGASVDTGEGILTCRIEERSK